ncbi:MAG: 6-carboxytetrahydropterin synthase [Parvularculaceae bacterium]
MLELTKSFQFDAAHFLNAYGKEHPYSRMHGHSFRVEITLSGEADAEKGWLRDLGDVARALEALRGELDHNTLNEIKGLETPTLENLCRWIADRLAADFPELKAVTVSRPSIGESCRLTL